MGRTVLSLGCVLWVLVCCSPAPSATPQPIRATAATPVQAVTISAHTPAILLEYMRQVHERVLLDYASCVDANSMLLSRAWNRGFDADLLCDERVAGSWQCFQAVSVELPVLVPPPPVEEFHVALAEALELGREAASSQEWFCQTLFAFGQPADGMWARLSVQIRACTVRVEGLRGQWAVLGGPDKGLRW